MLPKLTDQTPTWRAWGLDCVARRVDELPESGGSSLVSVDAVANRVKRLPAKVSARSRSPRQTVTIATFNINNVNRRLPNLVAWLNRSKPDVVCLQELKTTDHTFPAAAIQAAGYFAIWRGQRTYNGVAILAKAAEPILTRDHLPGNRADDQSRYIEAAVKGVLIASVYLPNGKPQPGPKFDYNLAWFERLIAHAQNLYGLDAPVVLAGDFNVVATIKTSTRAGPGRRTHCYSPKAAPAFSACSIKVGSTPYGPATPMSRCTRFGTTSEIDGAAMQGCASISSC